ncbi:hypothetical protein ACG2K1_01855 [Neisseria sp. 23W00296]|uniref:hypothetical protein n=1 Tax=unclassified Neisseria TaxID=2623750 RepID=UPI003756DFEA
MNQNRKDTRQQAADSMGNTARRSNAVYFLFWLTIKNETGFQTAFLWLAGFATPNPPERHHSAQAGILAESKQSCGSQFPYRQKDARLRGNDGGGVFMQRPSESRVWACCTATHVFHAIPYAFFAFVLAKAA